MDELTYKTIKGGNTAVFLGKRRVGTIVVIRLATGARIIQGYEYRPKGSTHLGRGEIYPTFEACVGSLT